MIRNDQPSICHHDLNTNIIIISEYCSFQNNVGELYDWWFLNFSNEIVGLLLIPHFMVVFINSIFYGSFYAD